MQQLKLVSSLNSIEKDIQRKALHITFNTVPHDIISYNVVNVKYTNDDIYTSLQDDFRNMKNILLNAPVCLHMYTVKRCHKKVILHLFIKATYSFTKYITSHRKDHETVYIIDQKNEYDLMFQFIDAYTRLRDIANEPANVMTPRALAFRFKGLFNKIKSVNVDIFNSDYLRKHGFNLVYSIGKASVNKPYFVKIEYNPGTKSLKRKTIALIGKGVTFDAGGLNIKTGSANSFEMKGDKIGACVACGITYMAAIENLDCRIVCLLPLVENIISGDVVHPGDIVRCYNGKTVEILNSDAEGRLIMADALSYAETFNPDYVLDFATLTGWAQMLHCDTSCVYFTTSKALRGIIENASESVGERVWAMPPWLEYKKYTKSSIADFKNHDLRVGNCNAGSGFMAAMFLANFVPAKCIKNWVHFDITNIVTNKNHILDINSFLLGYETVRKIIKVT